MSERISAHSPCWSLPSRKKEAAVIMPRKKKRGRQCVTCADLKTWAGSERKGEVNARWVRPFVGTIKMVGFL